MHIILAADTTTGINTVAVCQAASPDDCRILAETITESHRLHSERLIATVDCVLTEAGLRLEEVTALAISNGPGSFTGLRIGAATWKGLALARRLPLVAVPTLDAMTRLGAFRDGTVCPLIDARMKEVFGAVYRFKNGIREKCTPDRVCPVESLLEGLEPPVFVLGDGARIYRERIAACLPDAVYVEGLCAAPRASAVAAEAACLLAAGVDTDPAHVSPVYLRKSQAEVNRALRARAESGTS
jgi:tRNA threonylcarbamoyladenosine biosynthesis protein TsaB